MEIPKPQNNDLDHVPERPEFKSFGGKFGFSPPKPTLTLGHLYKSLIKAGSPPRRAHDFCQQHWEDPRIWKLFEKIALELIRSGAARIGAKQIFEIMRQKAGQSFSSKVTNSWKCNNIYTPFYARMFVLKYPQFKDRFEFRKMGGQQ